MANILIKQGLEIAVPDFVITTDEARKIDLTSIIQTGTTASQAISAGTYFYLNDVLVRAKVDIANGATFTLNTNYEVVTAGALNELNDKFNNLKGVTLQRETSEIAISATQSVTSLNLNDVQDIFIAVSFNQAFTYASIFQLPYIEGINFRHYHYINGNSVGMVQATITSRSSIAISNGVNEAIKVRIYVRKS